MKVGDVEPQEKNSIMEITTWSYLQYMDYSVFRTQPKNKYKQVTLRHIQS